MSKSNRSQKLHEWQASQRPSKSTTTAKDSTDGWVQPRPCHVCGEVVPGAYGHTTLQEVVWSCSAVCERAVQTMRKEYYAARHPREVAPAPAG